ncbi:UNVERIFIED_CONTAM: hypothetical protein FKN15_005613 [Acipenser sinensis]
MATNAGVNVNAGSRANATSFQKKSRSKLVSIPGTRPSVQNGQLLVSTGVTSLDYVIEEDKYDSYSRMLLKYFLAEGVVCGHSLFIASSRDHPGDILQELPAPLLDEISNTEVEKELAKAGDSSRETQDSMKIAWRYQNLPKVQTTLASSSRFGHYYDVSKSMSTDMCEAATCHSFFLPNELPLESAAESSKMNMGYIKLLRSIQGVIHKEGFDGAGPQNKAIMGRITKLCDTVVSLESFSGSERETNPLYKDYHEPTPV